MHTNPNGIADPLVSGGGSTMKGWSCLEGDGDVLVDILVMPGEKTSSSS